MSGFDPDLRRNYIVNLLDGGFFGLGLGFASFSTVIPLYVATLTDSAYWIAMVMAVHTLGWQLPQLFIARSVTNQVRFKPMTMRLTVQERLPFVGMAVIALLTPTIGTQAALILIFIMLAWQGIGAGLTANPWQNLIHRVIPNDYLTTFFGMQAAVSSLFSSGGAIAAGFFLDSIPYPQNFAGVFFFAAIGMSISFAALGMTRESPRSTPVQDDTPTPLWTHTLAILRNDRNFTWLIISRALCQFGLMGASFLTVHVVKNLGANEVDAGIMTSVLFISQVVSNLLLGRLADRWSRHRCLEIGIIALVAASLIAWLAKTPAAFYVVMALMGVVYTAIYPILMSFTLQFGDDSTRPTYVGMANSLITPVTLIAPLIGGWLASRSGYPSAFLASSVFALAAALLLHFFVSDPIKRVPL